MENPQTVDPLFPCRHYGSDLHPIIRGMESVVATVSGYHGTERFKLIKLIAQTGANFVGAMTRSTTHLVCWKFEGKKYDLARQFGMHIVSHCWFEECLKEGKRLAEGPYTMQSGKDAGPVTWESPAVLDNYGKKKSLSIRERNPLHDTSNTSDCIEVVEMDATCFDEFPWSYYHLLNEDCLPSVNSKMKSSKLAGKSKKVLKNGCKSSSNGNSKPPTYDVDNRPMCSSRLKRNNGNASGTDVTDEPSYRSRRLVLRSESRKLMSSAELSSKEEYCFVEGSSYLETIKPIFVDVDNLRNTVASSSQGMTSENISFDVKETRTHELECDQNMEKLHDYIVSVESHRPESGNALCSHEGTPWSEHSQKDNCLTDAGENQNEQRKEDDQVESAGLHTTELSCVICWTDFSPTRGVLPCGHRFCYLCIQGWADCMASRKKISSCPLCKATFTHIIKVEEATSSSDQKIYSQTIPCGLSNADMFMISDARVDQWAPLESVCNECHNCEPEDLLVSCHICHNRWVHTCCFDPPLLPWTCIHCRDLRMLYQHFH